jgi:U2-associated protein SR140
VERGSVRSAMLFALEHADACKLISNALIESLTQSDTALSTKLARLYLLSDILHNAATPAVRGAGAFRSELQHRLKEVFVSFRAASLTIESRLASEAFKDKVLRVLRVWYAWSTFAPSKLDELESLFLNGSADPVVGGDDHIDGVPM